MSVLIRGMEMPKSCAECEISQKTKSGMHCIIASRRNHFSCTTSVGSLILPFYCPLIPVPPHGKLIDADAVSLDGGPYEYDEWCKWALEQYQDAPTIIPAEEGE